eukprot:g5478.t1
MSLIIPSIAAYAIDHPHKYTFGILMPSMVMGLAMAAPLYGVTVWVTPVNAEFHPGENWAMSNGDMTYIGSLALLMTCLSGVVAGPIIKRCGATLTYFVGLLGIVAGLCLCALSLQQQLLWLLYPSFVLFVGLGGGFQYMSVLQTVMAWCRAIGKPGVAAGIIGSSLGTWAAAFAYLGPFLIGWLGT